MFSMQLGNAISIAPNMILVVYLMFRWCRVCGILRTRDYPMLTAMFTLVGLQFLCLMLHICRYLLYFISLLKILIGSSVSMTRAAANIGLWRDSCFGTALDTV